MKHAGKFSSHVSANSKTSRHILNNQLIGSTSYKLFCNAARLCCGQSWASVAVNSTLQSITLMRRQASRRPQTAASSDSIDHHILIEAIVSTPQNSTKWQHSRHSVIQVFAQNALSLYAKIIRALQFKRSLRQRNKDEFSVDQLPASQASANDSKSRCNGMCGHCHESNGLG